MSNRDPTSSMPTSRCPRKVVPGVKMQYDGLGDAAARADVIAFLQTLK